jgi:hypothetical protein
VAAPTFIGGGNPVYGSSTGWPASLTIAASDAPTGAASGDRLVLCISVRYGQRTFPLPVDDTLASFDGLSTWTSIGRAQSSVSGSASTSYTQLWSYTIRNSSTLYPFTITPIGTTSGTTYTPILSTGYYRAQLFAWRPSRGYSSRGLGSSNNTQTLLPNTTYGSQSLSDPDGIIVAVAALDSDSVGSLSTANGFTERFTQPEITNRGGSLVVADYGPGSTGTYPGPIWTKPSGPRGAAVLMSFNPLDPPLDGVGEWGVDQVRW